LQLLSQRFSNEALGAHRRCVALHRTNFAHYADAASEYKRLQMAVIDKAIGDRALKYDDARERLHRLRKLLSEEMVKRISVVYACEPERPEMWRLGEPTHSVVGGPNAVQQAAHAGGSVLLGAAESAGGHVIAGTKILANMAINKRRQWRQGQDGTPPTKTGEGQ
jgi:hypothetical protein